MAGEYTNPSEDANMMLHEHPRPHQTYPINKEKVGKGKGEDVNCEL